MARLILDTGAVLAFLRGDARVMGALRLAKQRGDDVVLPPVVVAQVLRGSARDAPAHRLINSVWVPFAGLRLARIAGVLLGISRTQDVADAFVIAEALRARPSVVLTSDPQDMERLANGEPSLTIIPV